MTEEQKKALQRVAIERAKSRKKPSIGQTIYDNIVGDDDPETMNLGEKLGTLLNMGGEGLTLGLVGDEAAAGADALIGRGSYDERLKFHRGNEEKMREDHPVTSLVAEVAPAMALPVGAGLKGGSVMAKAFKSGLTAGAAGGVYGFAEGEGGVEDRLKNAAIVGGISAPFGAATPYAARGIERYLNKTANKKMTRAAVAAAPDAQSLRAQSTAAYKAADQVPLPRAGLANAVQNASNEISPYRGINSKLMPKTAGVMDELTDAATAPRPTVPFGELEEVRQLAQVPRRAFDNPKEQRGGAIIAKAIDDFVEQADPKTSKAISEARKMWGRLRKSEMIDEAIEKAANQASGFENGLRVQFRAILNNSKKKASLTKAEIGAIREVVEGTKTGNWMKKLGKLGFGRGQQSNVLSGTAGTVAFGPGSLIAGQLGGKLAESITGRNAARAAALVRSGGAPNPMTVARAAPQLPGLMQYGLNSMVPRAVEGLSSYVPR